MAMRYLTFPKPAIEALLFCCELFTLTSIALHSDKKMEFCLCKVIFTELVSPTHTLWLV